MTTETPRVYIACLAAYNNGKLHGAWVDATDEDEINEAIAEVLKTSPEAGAEEHAFHDYEGFGNSLGEYTSVENIAAVGALIEEHGLELVKGMRDHGAMNAEEIESKLENRLGVYETLEEYAEASYEDRLHELNLPDEIERHIDWQSMARDWETGGLIFTVRVGDELHIFSNN